MIKLQKLGLVSVVLVTLGTTQAGLAQNNATPKTIADPYVEFVGFAFGGQSYETLDGVDVSTSEQTHPVPGAFYFMVSHDGLVLRPEFSFVLDGDGNSQPSATLSIGYLLAEFVEAGLTLQGGSAAVEYSANGQSAEATQSSRTLGVYARAHIAISDELTVEAGGRLGLGLSSYDSDLTGSNVSTNSTSFEAGMNIKSVYHLSEHLDLVATFAFIFSRVPVTSDDQQGDSDDAIAVYTYAFSPLGLRLKF